MTEEQAKELLQKYLDQQASPEEQKKVEEWYATLPAKDVELTADQKAVIGEQMFVQLKATMYEKPKRNKVLKLQTFYKIAAAVLIMVTLGLMVWKISSPVKPVGNQVTVVTGATERKRITLSDGSVVLLGPAAKLSYPKVFAASSRQISLKEGEAFFDVAHQEKRPFTVHTTSGIDIKVLGTSFKVKSYQASKQLEVAVVTGKVAVSNQKGNLGTLVKDEFLTYDKSAERAAIRKIKPVAFIEFAFDGTTLDQVISKLQYAYSIKILLNDSTLAKLKTTASFSSKQSPEEILDIICSLHHLKFNGSKNHKTFNIYK
ncbi:FecR family protein [Pedobacter jeongneungensis]|uniref:FecR family protein n=1 Tax=Pedobacter jeongneungensis TaxID=947309 RepID=UPI000468FD5C|nr:FecR domain-containing protein [Pedobacter jeongneungensis]